MSMDERITARRRDEEFSGRLRRNLEEQRDILHRLGSESVRVCPHNPDEKGCWWVVSGNPHSGDGYGCICLIDPQMWTRVQR